MNSLPFRAVIECVGTFIMVLCGTGAIVLHDSTSLGLTNFDIALAFGLSVALVIFLLGRYSGAHINPAVTIGFWATGKFPPSDSIIYIIAQFIGGLSASALLLHFYPLDLTLGASLPKVSLLSTFLIELGLAFALMYVILWVSNAAQRIKYWSSVLIGGTVFLEAYFCGPLTGASMNPARSLGPAVVSGNLQHLWIYLVATVLGALAAVMLCSVVKGKECCDPGKACFSVRSV